MRNFTLRVALTYTRADAKYLGETVPPAGAFPT
jgi:hypothetical protein